MSVLNKKRCKRRDANFFMVSSIFKFEHRFPFLIFGHYKYPKMKSRKKSLKKNIYKTINYQSNLKNLLFFNNNPLCDIFNYFVLFLKVIIA